MNSLATWKILALMVGLLALIHGEGMAKDNEYEAVDGPNVRVMRHDDGSRTVFIRSPDNKKLTKKRFSNGTLTMMTNYWMDLNGNPTGCRILDGQNQLLFKVQYGYRKSDGQLVKELMFDARVTRTDPNTGKEMPVQTITYLYDAEGNRSAPIIVNHLPGKTFEEVFGEKSSALDVNPFNENAPKRPANPNARPVSR